MNNVSFVPQSVRPLGICPSDQDTMLRHIEYAGRKAWKSEDKAKEGSHEAMFRMLANKGHTSVFEHSNIAINTRHFSYENRLECFGDRSHFHPQRSIYNGILVSGNVRAWRESLRSITHGPSYDLFAGLLKQEYPILFEDYCGPSRDMSYCGAHVLSDSAQRHFVQNDIPVFSFEIVCDRGISHEVVRHRILSFTQESTRYVNYGGSGLTLIMPEELERVCDDSMAMNDTEGLLDLWSSRASILYSWYLEDLNRGKKPQIARDILPNLLKTELIISGRFSEWKHFVKLRSAMGAHPRIRRIANDIKEYFSSIGAPLV